MADARTMTALNGPESVVDRSTPERGPDTTGYNHGLISQRSSAVAWFRDIDQDLRYAVRTLCASPGFAAVAVLTLGLGIGANTAIFSVVNAVVLRPLPYRDPASLVLLDTAPLPVAEPWMTAAWRARAQTLSDFAGFNGPVPATLVAGGESEQVQSAVITWNFLSLLGVGPAAGRDFMAADAAPGAPAVALVSHHLWTARFGRDASVVGRTVTVSGAVLTIVGITPPAFRFPAAGTPLQPATQPDLLRVAAASQDVRRSGLPPPVARSGCGVGAGPPGHRDRSAHCVEGDLIPKAHLCSPAFM